MTVDGFDLLRRHPRVGVGKFHTVVAKAARQHFCIDCEKVRTVLRNLLDNAFKYSLPESQPILLSISEIQDCVVIRIQDDGQGIPDGERASVFEPFFRIDPSRSKKTGGYGLGLSMCKRIVEAHGATIYIESNPVESTKKGRTVRPFFVRLSQVCYVRSRWQDVDT